MRRVIMGLLVAALSVGTGMPVPADEHYRGTGMPEAALAPIEAPAQPLIIPANTPVNLRTLREWIDQLKQQGSAVSRAAHLFTAEALLVILEDIQERLDALERGQDKDTECETGSP